MAIMLQFSKTVKFKTYGKTLNKSAINYFCYLINNDASFPNTRDAWHL